MQENNLPLSIRNPKGIKTLSIIIFIIDPLLFLIINMLFPRLSFFTTMVLFIFMLLGIYLAIHLYTTGCVGEKFIFLFQIRKVSYKSYKFLYNKFIFKYNNKEFKMIPFLNVTPQGIIRGLYYSWGTLDFGIPKSHLELWIKLSTTNVFFIEDPYQRVLQKYTGSLGEFMKPHRYIQEDLKEYGKNVSDLLFLGFTKRGKDKYLLAMLEWDTKPYVIAKVLDIMIEIVEKYEEK